MMKAGLYPRGSRRQTVWGGQLNKDNSTKIGYKTCSNSRVTRSVFSSGNVWAQFFCIPMWTDGVNYQNDCSPWKHNVLNSWKLENVLLWLHSNTKQDMWNVLFHVVKPLKLFSNWSLSFICFKNTNGISGIRNHTILSVFRNSYLTCSLKTRNNHNICSKMNNISVSI